MRLRLARGRLPTGEQGRHTHPNLCEDGRHSIRIGVDEQHHAYLSLWKERQKDEKSGTLPPCESVFV